MVARNEYLDKILTKVADVPTLPARVLRVMQMIEDPLCAAQDLSRVIQADPAMAAKVLKLANSAYYGFRQQIANIPQAVTLLGFATLKNALLSAAVFDMFRVGGTGFDLPGLWKHSVATATAAKLLAKRVRFPNAEKAFTAGLLHDIGKVMIARYLPASVSAIVEAVERNHLTIHDAERRIVGLPHPDFGAWVLTRWGLPTPLVEAVEFHHRPTEAQYCFDLAGIVYLANILTRQAGIGNGGDSLPREVEPEVLEYFGLAAESLGDLQETIVFKRLEIEAFASAVAA